MDKWIKYALVAGAAYGVYWYVTKGSRASVSGGANQGSNTSESLNAEGQSGQNTCKPPREVIQGNCVLRGNTQKATAVAKPKVSPNKPSIVQRGFV